MPASNRPCFAAVGTVLTALLAATSASSAWARDVKLMLPIEAALQQPLVRQALSPTVVLRFGSASDLPGSAAQPPMEVEGVVDPYVQRPGSNPGTFRDRRTDEQTCLDAFRKALLMLQQQARQRGADAVVGIVSNYDNTVFDSRDTYECHVGLSRGVVALKGRAGRADQAAAAAASPSLAAAPAATGGALPSRPAAAADVAPARLASGYALIDDLDAIPFLDDAGREGYREWLTRSTPRAFALSSRGHWHATWSLTPTEAGLPADPNERALLLCARKAQMPCKLYAVNRAVVWTRDAR